MNQIPLGDLAVVYSPSLPIIGSIIYKSQRHTCRNCRVGTIFRISAIYDSEVTFYCITCESPHRTWILSAILDMSSHRIVEVPEVKI